MVDPLAKTPTFEMKKVAEFILHHMVTNFYDLRIDFITLSQKCNDIINLCIRVLDGDVLFWDVSFTTSRG